MAAEPTPGDAFDDALRNNVTLNPDFVPLGPGLGKGAVQSVPEGDVVILIHQVEDEFCAAISYRMRRFDTGPRAHLFLFSLADGREADVLDLGPVGAFRNGDRLIKHGFQLIHAFDKSSRGHSGYIVEHSDEYVTDEGHTDTAEWTELLPGPLHVYVHRLRQTGWEEVALPLISPSCAYIDEYNVNIAVQMALEEYSRGL